MKLYHILILRLALALYENELKISILTTSLFGPQFAFSQRFEQRN